MFKNILQWNFKVEGREFNLHLDADSPLSAVKEVSFQMMAHCVNVENQQKAQQEALKAKQEEESAQSQPQTSESVAENNIIPIQEGQ